MRVAMAVVVGAACALSSGGREPPVAPPPRAKLTDADWLPKPGATPWVEGAIVNGERTRWKVEGLTIDPLTAFPDLVAPPHQDLRNWKPGTPHPDAEAFARACPRLHGTVALTIEPTDDTLRKLLKAQIHQGVLEFRQHQVDKGRRWPPSGYHTCLRDIQSAAAELWAEQPKERISWLEELVIAGKHSERTTRTCVLLGTVHLEELHAVSRLRLKFEAELWKAKNPK